MSKVVMWFICSLFCHWQRSTSCMCVETHLGGEGKHPNLETHTPTFHAQTQMEHNSFPPGGGMEVRLVVKNQSQDLLQWRSPPVGSNVYQIRRVPHAVLDTVPHYKKTSSSYVLYTVHKPYTYVLYNALWWLHMIMYTQTQCIHTVIDIIYLQNGTRNISHECILLTVTCTPYCT